jgi:hypothetical protein
MHRTLLLVYDAADREPAEQLAVELERRGILVRPGDEESRQGGGFAALCDAAIRDGAGLGVVLSAAATGSPWLREELTAELRDRFEAEGGGVLSLRLDDCDVPPLLAHRRRFDLQLGSRVFDEMVEALLPAPTLAARLDGLRDAYRQAIDEIRRDPIDQDWERRTEELGAALAEALDVRFFLEWREAVPAGAERRTFLERFESLDQWGIDVREPDWKRFVPIRRRLVHDMKSDIAVVQLLVELARDDDDSGESEHQIGAALDKLSALFDRLA